MRIKVCGIKHPDMLAAVARLGVDYIGHIFHPKSMRHTSEIAAERLCLVETGKALRVGVFVNMEVAGVIRYVEKYRLDMVQLHGDESPETCRAIGRHIPVIKAIAVENGKNVQQAMDYEGSADVILFDTKTARRGGSGVKFDWRHLDDYRGAMPFFVSGGIEPGDVGRLKDISHDRLFGVDINSRFEKAPGIKDIDKLTRFIDQMRTQ